MKISTLLYTIKQGFVNIFRNKWFSLASIATISACLFLFGTFYAVVINFQNILYTTEEGVCVTVFFHNEMDKCESHTEGQIPGEERLNEIGEMLKERAEVSEVHFVDGTLRGQSSDLIISERTMQRDFRRILWRAKIITKYIWKM